MLISSFLSSFIYFCSAVSEEKSKMSQPIRGQGAILFFLSARKTQTWSRTLRSCFLLSFIEFHSAFSEEKWKMSQPIRDQGCNLVFLIRPKNTNLVEDIEILLPVKFYWVPFCGFRGEVENMTSKRWQTTDDGQSMITIVRLSLRFRGTKKGQTIRNQGGHLC